MFTRYYSRKLTVHVVIHGVRTRSWPHLQVTPVGGCAFAAVQLTYLLTLDTLTGVDEPKPAPPAAVMPPTPEPASSAPASNDFEPSMEDYKVRLQVEQDHRRREKFNLAGAV